MSGAALEKSHLGGVAISSRICFLSSFVRWVTAANGSATVSRQGGRRGRGLGCQRILNERGSALVVQRSAWGKWRRGTFARNDHPPCGGEGEGIGHRRPVLRSSVPPARMFHPLRRSARSNVPSAPMLDPLRCSARSDARPAPMLCLLHCLQCSTRSDVRPAPMLDPLRCHACPSPSDARPAPMSDPLQYSTRSNAQ